VRVQQRRTQARWDEQQEDGARGRQARVNDRREETA